jgi:hypothetical protein
LTLGWPPINRRGLCVNKGEEKRRQKTRTEKSKRRQTGEETQLALVHGRDELIHLHTSIKPGARAGLDVQVRRKIGEGHGGEAVVFAW